MRPRYYVHMGPKAAEKVSCMWKAAHIIIFVLLLGSSSVATACIYNILDMYDFRCIIYAKISFEKSYEERYRDANNNETDTNSSVVPKEVTAGRFVLGDGFSENNVDDNSKNKEIQYFEESVTDTQLRAEEEITSMSIVNWADVARAADEDRLLPYFVNGSNNTGFLNMRKTIFSTIYMCDLMLFAPLASIVMAIFLGALIGVAGKGGAGNPGDVLPNPWICVYPFLGLCAFMMIFSFIADNLFHKGLGAFCLRYYEFTKSKACSEAMDQFTVQFAPNRSTQQPFYMNYFIGSYAVQATSAMWVLQLLVYIFRIFCLADFSLYLTRIKLKDDKSDPKMASIVLKVMDSKTKIV